MGVNDTLGGIEVDGVDDGSCVGEVVGSSCKVGMTSMHSEAGPKHDSFGPLAMTM